MKKFLLTCALALSVVALAEHRASAWCNFNLSAGVNLSWQHGPSNNWCFGFCGSNQCPSPPCFGDGGYYPAYDGHLAGAYPAYDGHYAAPYAVPANASPAPGQQGPSFPPAPKPADDGKKSGYLGTWGNGYQTVGYSYGYQAGQYGYPSTGYLQYPAGGYFQAPSYWYGR